MEISSPLKIRGSIAVAFGIIGAKLKIALAGLKDTRRI
jgi:hypothetical protein